MRELDLMAQLPAQNDQKQQRQPETQDALLAQLQQGRQRRKFVELIQCPRCGQWGRVSIEERSNREYVYVRHGSKKACYLGPYEGYYAVQQVHGPLALISLDAVDYAEVMAHAAEKFIEQQVKKDDNDVRAAEKVIDSLMSLADVIREACQQLGPKRSVCLERVLKRILL